MERREVRAVTAAGRAEQTRSTSFERRLGVGSAVEVRRRFDDAWARGFEVSGVDPDGYTLRRASDGAQIPAVFGPDDVRIAGRPEPNGLS